VANTVTEHIKMRQHGRVRVCPWFVIEVTEEKKGIKAWNCVNR